MVVVRGETYRIGEAASRTGLTPETLRFYERLGLFPKPPRSPGGFRHYPAITLERVRFIKRAQALGLTLDEIHELVSFNGRGGLRRCWRVHALLSRKLSEIDEHLKELKALRVGLKHTLRQCEHALEAQDETACPVIELGQDH